MRARTWSFDRSARIVSKFFGSEGSFILDEYAEYLPSAGHVWIPKHFVARDNEAEMTDESDLDVLRAYTAILNSRIFIDWCRSDL